MGGLHLARLADGGTLEVRVYAGDRGAFRLVVGEGEGDGVEETCCNTCSTAMTSSTIRLHCSSGCSFPHHVNETMRRRKPFAPTFERPDQSIVDEGEANVPSALVVRSAGCSRVHHAVQSTMNSSTVLKRGG